MTDGAVITYGAGVPGNGFLFSSTMSLLRRRCTLFAETLAVPYAVSWCVPQPNQWVLQTDCKAVLLPQNPLAHLKQTW